MVKIETECEISVLNNTQKTCVEVIKFDENRNVHNQGYCKLKINRLSKFVLIEPINENFKDITGLTAPYKWKFIRQKNIIFVFGEFDYQDFALIFNNQKICRKAYNGIFKKRSKDYVGKKLLQKRFLNPFFKEIVKAESSRLKEIMEEWIQKHEGNEKEYYLKLIKMYKENPEFVVEEDVKPVKEEIAFQKKGGRKRKIRELENNDANAEESDECDNEFQDNSVQVPCKKRKIFSSEENTKIIDETLFEIVNAKHQNGFRRKLLIFTSSERTHCYEYSFYSNKEIFSHECRKHGKRIKAILKIDENGHECIKFENILHKCKPLKYDTEKYAEMKIIKKPNYEILENCSTQSKRMLMIFNPNDRSQCYEYYWDSKTEKFICCGCKSKRKLSAEICHENSNGECIRLLNDQHTCKMRTYDAQKYFQFHQFILAPKFEIQKKFKDGTERKILIIFDESDRKLCYIYFHLTSANIFHCNGCKLKRTTVNAKLSQNSDGEEYVILSNVKHVCSLKTYIPQNEKIFRAPNIKFMESNEKFASKLFIFNPDDQKMCYTFTQQHGRNQIRYYCLGCNHKTSNISKNRTTKGCVNVDLFKDNNGEYYVKMADDQMHICEPQKYEPEKYEISILKPKADYLLFRKSKKDCIYAAIFHPNDKNLCYQLYYQKTTETFRCYECEKKKVYVCLRFRQDSDGNEFIIPCKKEHICKPIKVSIIKNSPDAVFLEKLEIDETKKNKKQEKEIEIDESRILRLPNFELQRNTLGVPERKLIVFYGDDNKLCYEYRCDRNSFYCKNCKVSAKLETDENSNEKYLILGEKGHTCKPIKYEAEKEIVEDSNFMVFNRADEKKLTKLIIFTSLEKIDCYEYTFWKQAKCFRCCGCSSQDKIVSAKLLMDLDTKKECIQILSNNHVCTPKKFILEEFQPKTVPESGFKLCSNVNGKPNSKMILYDDKKDGYGYEYYLQAKLFVCNHCKTMKKRVTAKLMEKENGEKYLELSLETHICKSMKYEKMNIPENFRKE